MRNHLHALNVIKPGYPTVHVGPFMNQADQDRWMHRLRQTMVNMNTTHPRGTTIEAADYDPDLGGIDGDYEHMDPHLPTDAEALADLIALERLAISDSGHRHGSASTDTCTRRMAEFPDIYTRLIAEHGFDDGDRYWNNAVRELDSSQAHADHFAGHVKRCDTVTGLLDEVADRLYKARGVLDRAKEADWGGDGELHHIDHQDAVTAFEQIGMLVRTVGRITKDFRGEAEEYRAGNAADVEARAARIRQIRDEKQVKVS